MRKFFYVCGMFAVLAAVYRLPYLFPPHPNASLSYLVGFNNHVSMLTLLVGSLAFALVSKGAGLQLAPAGTSQTGPAARRWNTYLLSGVLILTAVLLALFWLRMRVGLTPATGEAAFFLDRYHEALRGGHVYHDFTFDYGPLLFYPPIWLYRLTGMPFIDAYFTILLMQWLAGFAALWYVLRRVASSTVGRALTFVVVAFTWLTSIGDMGSNYTPLRFIASSAAAALIFGLFRSGRRGWVLCLAGICSFATLFFYSPEQGIAFLLATILFFAICVRDRKTIAVLVLFAAGCAGVLIIGGRMGVLRPLVAFGGGNYDFPILPSKQSVFLLLALICAACLVVASFFRKDSARLELYLVSLGLAGCPAAFGRSDPGHIFINTMPAIIVVMMTLLQSGTALMVITLLASCLYIGTSCKAHTFKMWDAVDQVRDDQENRDLDENLSAAAALAGTHEVLAPFSVPITNRVLAGYPFHSGEYFGFAMPNPQLAGLKIAELQKHPTTPILVPTDFEVTCAPVSPSDANVMLQTILATPFVPPVVHTADVGSSLCEYVRTHYAAVAGLPAGSKYQLMEPRLSR